MPRHARALLVIAMAGALAGSAATRSLVMATGSEAGLPVPPDAAPGGPSVALADTSQEVRDAYSGVGLLWYGASCTAVLIRPGDGEVPVTAPAYALTNGHCVNLFDATTVLRDEPAIPGAGGVEFGVGPDGAPILEAPLSVIRWATMKGTDLAIVELADTLSGLLAQGVAAYPLASAAEPGTGVVVVGGPTSTDGTDRTLRVGSCTGGPAEDLFEWRWAWFGFPSNDCADIRPGSSGSPLFDPATGTVVGLVNTTTQGSEGIPDCAMGRPCELTSDGLMSVEGAVYGPTVGVLAGCFDASWTFTGPGPDCPLDQGDGLAVEGWTLSANPGEASVSGGPASPSTWDIRLLPASDEQTMMRFAEGRPGGLDCHDPSAYGDPVAIPGDLLFDPPLPTADGSHLMCLLGGSGTGRDATWQSPRFPTVLRAEVDRTPPSGAVELSVIDEADGWLVEPIFRPPDLSLYDWKWGPADSVSCTDPAGYEPYRRFPVLLERTDAPTRLCVIGYDDANNASPPLDRVFSAP